MPELLNKETGQRELIDAENMASALASNKYVTPDAIAVHSLGSDTYATPDQFKQDQSYAPAIDPAKAALESGHKIREDANSGIVGSAKALIGSGIGGATAGVFSPFEEAQEFHSNLSTLGTIGGAFLPGLVGDEAGFAGLFADQANVERAGASLSSKFLYGGELGGEVGTTGRAIERGLAKGAGELDTAKAASAIPEDLAALDAKGLTAAKDTELAGIEAARVPQRQAIAEDLRKFRSSLKEDEKIFLATKGIKESALPEGVEGLKIQEIGKTSLEADRAIDRLLRNPIALAKKPERAIEALQQQENALVQLQNRESTLRPMFAADTSGERVAALDAVPGALERNRALQQRIGAVIAKPSSERLSAIGDAQAALSAPKAAAPKSLLEDTLGGTIMGHVAGMASGLPIVGPMIGAKVGRFATDLVFGRMGKAVGAAGERTAAAAEKFLDVAKRSTPTLPIAATRILSRVAYAPSSSSEANDLAGLYKARAAEIKSQVMYDDAGKSVMRPDARAAMAAKLAPIRAFAPLVADKLESLGAARIEFLASKLPRRPDVGGIPMGPDHWQPSDMEMRAFARYVHAVEDPHGVEDRLANGTVTPEDAEAYNAVYPERAAALKQILLTKLPQLHKSLPYERRLALSIFTGVAVDPAMHPQVLAVLQGAFKNEPGSQGGTMAPRAQPQFGSVKKTSTDLQTPSQQRAEGTMR